jgi:CheY-like chemotaxis protein
MSVLVLVVDDELDVADLFRQQFRRELRAGLFVMEFAYSAAEALVRISRPSDVNLILLLSDINMPGMTGLELLPKVHQIRPDVPVVMITAYGDADTRARALKAGAAGFLTKPVDFQLLREEITERLKSFQSSASS